METPLAGGIFLPARFFLRREKRKKTSSRNNICIFFPDKFKCFIRLFELYLTDTFL